MKGKFFINDFIGDNVSQHIQPTQQLAYILYKTYYVCYNKSYTTNPIL